MPCQPRTMTCDSKYPAGRARGCANQVRFGAIPPSLHAGITFVSSARSGAVTEPGQHAPAAGWSQLPRGQQLEECSDGFRGRQGRRWLLRRC